MERAKELDAITELAMKINELIHSETDDDRIASAAMRVAGAIYQPAKMVGKSTSRFTKDPDSAIPDLKFNHLTGEVSET